MPTAAGSSVAAPRPDEVTERAPDEEPALTDGAQVRAAREERHTHARSRQPRAVVPADGARPENDHVHRVCHAIY